MSNKRNKEGYSDPTAYAAFAKIEKEEQQAKQLKKILGEICALSGYRLKGQVILVNKYSGYTVKL